VFDDRNACAEERRACWVRIRHRRDVVDVDRVDADQDDAGVAESLPWTTA
jgi:hypothetical protein